MGEPVAHFVEHDLADSGREVDPIPVWVEAQAIAGAVQIEQFLKPYAAFLDYLDKETAPVSEGR